MDRDKFILAFLVLVCIISGDVILNWFLSQQAASVCEQQDVGLEL